MKGSRLAATLLLGLTLALSASGVVVVTGESPAGSFTFVVDGYTVTGSLSQGVITHGGRVSMLMSIDQSIPTQYGSVQIDGSGTWVGETDFHSFNGGITGVIGTVQACVIFYCQSGSFSGSGTWTGLMTWNGASGAQGSGVFHGTLDLTGQQIAQSGVAPLSGNWTDTFQV